MPCTKAERVEIVQAMALERPLGEVHVILRRILEYDVCYTSEADVRAADELIERYGDLYDFTPRESVAL